MAKSSFQIDRVGMRAKGWMGGGGGVNGDERPDLENLPPSQ